MNNKDIINETISTDYLDNTCYFITFQLLRNLEYYDNSGNKLKLVEVESNGIELPKTPMFSKKPRRDKIYENDYNYGTLNLRFDEELRVDRNYESKYMADIRHPETSNIIKIVMNDCYQILTDLEIDWNDKNKKTWLVIFNKVLDVLSNKIYAKYLIFVCYCDILNIKYKIFWKVISEKQQYEILDELDECVDIGIYNNDFNIF